VLSTGGAFNSFWVLRIADAKREACFAHATISSESYEYDAAGNLVEKTVNSVTTEYAYDDIDQLVSEVRNGYSASYTYDANGNRTSKTLNGTTQSYVVDDADKLISITQGGNTVKSFTYDAAGGPRRSPSGATRPRSPTTMNPGSRRSRIRIRAQTVSATMDSIPG